MAMNEPDEPGGGEASRRDVDLLKDVWLKPRSVFRRLRDQPVGRADYLLSAAQGIVGLLAFSRMQNLGVGSEVGSIFFKAFTLGSLSGFAVVWIQAWIYTWLGRRVGGVATRAQMIHVLSYGGAPLVASLVMWCLAALLLGNAAFLNSSPQETDLFVVLLMHAQVIVHGLLVVWSVILQVMGLSEVHRLQTRGAAGTWLLGQFVAVLALLLVTAVIFGLGAPVPQG